MKRLILFLLLAVGWGSVLCGAPVPKLTGRAVDAAGVLSSVDRARVEEMLARFEARTGGQMAVFFEKSLPEGETVESRSLQVAENWKLGRAGEDNGLLLYFAIADRRNRLEVGYGWEGMIPDAQAGDMLRAMVPLLKQGKYAEATCLTISLAAVRITGKGIELPEGIDFRMGKEPGKSKKSPLPYLELLFMALAIGFFFWGRRGGRRGGGGFISFGGGGISFGGGGGGFSGGGGSFGGGGASGRW